MASPLVSHLAHVELLAPDAARVIRRLLDDEGLVVACALGGSAFLRGGADPLGYSVKVTEAATAAVGHVAWRSRGPDELERAVAALAASGRGLGWTAGDVGHGPAYRFQSPSGHVHELLWEAVEAPMPVAGAVRLDHVTLPCPGDPADAARYFVRVLAFAATPAPAPRGIDLTSGARGPEMTLVPAGGAARFACVFTGGQMIRDVVGGPAAGGESSVVPE
jgi:hypothetical protein